MLTNISYYQIFGLPVILYLGIIGFLFLIIAGFIGYLSSTGKIKTSIKTHKLFAGIGIVIALMHGTFAILSYL